MIKNIQIWYINLANCLSSLGESVLEDIFNIGPKCAKCKKTININNNWLLSFNDGKLLFYHISCYKEGTEK